MRTNLVGTLVLGFFMMGCQGQFDSMSLGSGDQSVDDKFNIEGEDGEKANLLKLAEEKARAADSLAEEVRTALDQIDTDLEIKSSDISIFKIGKLKGKIRGFGDRLQSVFGEMNSSIDDVRDRIDLVKEELRDKVAALDPSSAGHDQIVERAEDIIEKLEKIEDKISSVVEKLDEALDKVSDKLDSVISKVTSKLGLLGIPVEYLLTELKDKLIERLRAELKAKLGLD